MNGFAITTGLIFALGAGAVYGFAQPLHVFAADGYQALSGSEIDKTPASWTVPAPVEPQVGMSVRDETGRKVGSVVALGKLDGVVTRIHVGDTVYKPYEVSLQDGRIVLTGGDPMFAELDSGMAGSIAARD
ncbi:MAG: hypothetical protein WBF53_15760 [Litorimonas sp.]